MSAFDIFSQKDGYKNDVHLLRKHPSGRMALFSCQKMAAKLGRFRGHRWEVSVTLYGTMWGAGAVERAESMKIVLPFRTRDYPDDEVEALSWRHKMATHEWEWLQWI